MLELAGRGVPVHAPAVCVPQDRTDIAVVDRAVQRPCHRWRQWDEDDIAALAPDAEDAVSVFLAEVGDVRAAGFEDPESEEADSRAAVIRLRNAGVRVPGWVIRVVLRAGGRSRPGSGAECRR